MDWRKGLTKKEKLHLRDCNIRTRGTLKTQIENCKQHEEEKGIVLCWECRDIARKTGLWTN
jgi:hypothetical protein